MRNLKLFIRLGKIDEAQRIVYGTAADETPDHVKESFDYAGSKPYFEAWSANAAKVTDGKSLGNVRAMHGKVAAGKLEQLEFDDAKKAIQVGAKIVDDNEWTKVLEGVYTGFSIGGRYVSQRTEKGVTRYVADPSEISLVDLPCIPTATFDVVKADGATLQKMFKPGEDAVLAKAKELATLAKKDPEKDAAEFMDAARVELAKVVKDPASIEVDAETKPAAEVVEPTNEQIVAKASELAKAKGGNWMAHTDEAVTLLKTAEGTDNGAALGAGKKAEPAPAPAKTDLDKAAPGDDEGGAQVWTHAELEGQTFAKKADMRAALVKARADKAAATTAKPAADALAALETELGKKDGKTPKAKGAKDAKAEAADNGKDQGKQQKEQLDNEADAPKKYSPERLAELVKSGEAMADGAMPIVDEADLVAAAAIAKLSNSQRRHVIKRARALKLTDKLPDALRPVVTYAKVDTAELKKAASLYTVSSMIELLARLESCEECLECPSYYGDAVEVPAELKTKMGQMLVDFGDCVAEVLGILLQAMKDEEAGEAMARSAAATDLIKGITESATLSKLLKIAPAQAEPGALEKLEATVAAERESFAKTIGDMTSTLDEVTKRIAAIEATPLPPGTTSVTNSGKPVDKTIDGSAGVAQTAVDVLSDPGVLAKLADVAVRAAQQRPSTAIRNGGV